MRVHGDLKMPGNTNGFLLLDLNCITSSYVPRTLDPPIQLAYEYVCMLVFQDQNRRDNKAKSNNAQSNPFIFSIKMNDEFATFLGISQQPFSITHWRTER